jgi:hypothetical protein
MIEFDGNELCAARELVGHGEIVLIRTPSDSHQHVDELGWPRNIAESIGDCALVPLAYLNGTDFQRYPLVVGPKEAIRFLSTSGDRLPPEPFPYETARLRTHYREFRNLWLTREALEPYFFVFQIGELLAQMHSKKILHGDAHIDNWGVIDGTVVIGDNDCLFLHCPPSPAQCATDIYPLLPTLQPQHWLNFRLGYLNAWPQGQPVIDQIQLSDRTGWAMAFRTKQFATSIQLINHQLRSESDPVLRVMLLANLALATSCSGKPDEAMHVFLDCAQLAKFHCSYAARGLAFLLGVLHLHQGDRSTAVAILRDITRDPENLATRFAATDAQFPIINL